MKLTHPFSVRLANGSERTFATAQEMAKWIENERSLQFPVRRRRNSNRSSTSNKRANRVSTYVCSPQESPLDRFNRKSMKVDPTKNRNESK